MIKPLNIVFAAVLTMTCTGTACATQSMGNPYRFYDPLLWAHLVVRGEVLSITEAPSTSAEWGIRVGGQPYRITVETVVVRVSEVLKGQYVGGELPVAVFSGRHYPQPNPIKVGDEVVLAVKLNGATHRYLLENYSGLLTRRGTEWQHPDPGTYTYMADKRALSWPEVEERVASMSAQNISEQADIIVSGTLRSVSNDHEDQTTTASWKMSVDSVLKGNPPPGIEFSMAWKGKLPAWAVPIPMQASPGQKWLVFLRRSDDKYVPFAGLNGMLREDGERLIYDDSVEYPLSRKEVSSIVESANRAHHE
ncbi:MAG TPA: hypothetical protein VFH88_12785 [Candidatus Krumholzibacteria bacterium]|nr:hypothetical protein [Candidatus Krumholzibacteria bacterium]